MAIKSRTSGSSSTRRMVARAPCRAAQPRGWKRLPSFSCLQLKTAVCDQQADLDGRTLGGSAVDSEPAAQLGCESMDLAEPQSRPCLGRGCLGMSDTPTLQVIGFDALPDSLDNRYELVGSRNRWDHFNPASACAAHRAQWQPFSRCVAAAHGIPNHCKGKQPHTARWRWKMVRSAAWQHGRLQVPFHCKT